MVDVVRSRRELLRATGGRLMAGADRKAKRGADKATNAAMGEVGTAGVSTRGSVFLRPSVTGVHALC